MFLITTQLPRRNRKKWSIYSCLCAKLSKWRRWYEGDQSLWQRPSASLLCWFRCLTFPSILHRFLVVFRSDVFAGQFITNMKKISFWQCEQLPHPPGQHFDYLCFWFRSGFSVETHTWTDLTQPTFESTWSFLSGLCNCCLDTELCSLFRTMNLFHLFWVLMSQGF